MSAVLGRRVDGADAGAGRSGGAVRRERDRAAVVPQEPGTVGVGLPAPVGRLDVLDVRRVAERLVGECP